MAMSDKHSHSADGESDTDLYDSDDSQQDPTFDVLDLTRSSFSKLSIKKKAKSRNIKDMDEGSEEDPDVIVPELDEKEQKSFEGVQKIIEAGQLEKLKVDQCKVYLRKHGLRLTGNKDILTGRIKEHLDIMNGGGEKKYPMSSFVLNCKGDACTGDTVMFEQNVYEMFNIASRSASGPPCGTRIVAGRIVKESYGAAKQQHTFTIEVLWSKGEKPLPPLHPLLIKGRNLYRLKTVRQRWENEGDRQKMLCEKHNRGAVARTNREARVQEKEMRQMLKGNRVSRVEDQNGKKEENTRKISQSLPTNPRKHERHLDEQQGMQKAKQEQTFQQKGCWNTQTWKESTSVPLVAPYSCPIFLPNANMQLERVHQRQPLASVNSNPSGHGYEQNIISNIAKCNSFRSSIQRHGHEESMNVNNLRDPSRKQQHARGESINGGNPRMMVCRHYARGRCYYGDQCKYSHDYGENHNYGQRKKENLPSNLRHYY